MTENRFNLLTERLIGATAGGGVLERLTLPEVLAALARGEPLEFAALQPYQFHAWHAFLVQLGALAAFHAGLLDVAKMRGAEQWAEVMRALTDGRDEPWRLIVPDLKAPAFMQPPVPEGSLAEWDDDNSTATPDAIDLLATAKNHDVKMERIAAPAPEHWIYALVSLQTMEGYGGKMNYGIARMNGGFGNRPCFAAARDLAWPTRFVRDTNLLVAVRDKIAEEHGFDPDGGHALLWLEPWDGIAQLAISELDPFFIEICRRIRLIDGRGQIVARWTTTEVQRVDVPETEGQKKQKLALGDPWVPTNRSDGTAVTSTDLRYDRIPRLLFPGDRAPAVASQVQPVDGEKPSVICQVFVRGQGGTDGYHERVIPVPPKARAWLATEDGRLRLGETSKKRIEEVKNVASKALRPALAALLQGGPEKLNFRDPRIDPFAASFDREVDRVFFAELFADLDLSFEAARIKWLHQLLGFARNTLADAKQSAPIPAARVFRARAAADRVFNGAAHRMRAAAGESNEQEGVPNESSTD
jgi:CRISPR system Cascade subunit CasA